MEADAGNSDGNQSTDQNNGSEKEQPQNDKGSKLKTTALAVDEPNGEGLPIVKNIHLTGTPKKEKGTTVEKEVKAIGKKVGEEGVAFAESAIDIITGIDRGAEIRNIRNKKVQISRTLSR